jgi:uncharacterized protein YhaN
MRMAEFHIDGFGCLADVSFANVPTGLSIVLGDNEAGKSTLLAFLRSILFGLPERKQKDYYPPLKGGRKGGRIVLLNQHSGRIVVERFEGKGTGALALTFADGTRGGDEDFRQLVGSATADLYRSVFAFSLSELQVFESLKTDKVRDAMYSAGIGIGRRTITDVTQELKKQSGELFAPSGSKPTMNQTLARIEMLRQQIKEHEQDLDEYERLRSECEAIETLIEQIRLALDDLKRRSESVRVLQQAWDEWIVLGASRERLLSLPQIASFPEGGIQRLDLLNVERRESRDQFKAAIAEKETDEASLSIIHVDDVLLSASEKILRLDKGLELYEQNRQAAFSLHTELELAAHNLEELLHNLGEEWDEGKLRQFDLSVPVRQEIDASRRASMEATVAVRDRQLQWEQEVSQLNEDLSLEGEAKTHLGQLPRPSETLDVAGIQKLRLGRQTYESARQDLPGVEKQCAIRLDHLLDTLRHIGPNWTEDRLKEFDTSLAVQEDISAHQKRLSDLHSDHKDGVRRVQDATQVLHDAKAAVAHATAVLSATPTPKMMDEGQLVQQKRLLRALRSEINEADNRRAQLLHLEERKRDLHAQVTRLQQDGGLTPIGTPRWLLPATLLLGFAALLGLGFGRGDWISGSVVLALSALVAVLPILARGFRTAGAPGHAPDHSRDIGDLNRQSASLDGEIEELQQRIADLGATIVSRARTAGIDGVADGRAVDEAEEHVERDLDVLQRRRPVEQKLQDAEANLTTSEETLLRTKQIATAKTTLRDQARREWEQWLVKAGLPDTLVPDSAAKVLARLDAAREQLKGIDGDRERIRRMTSALREYELQAQSIASGAEVDVGITDGAGELVDALIKRLDKHEHDQRSLTEASRRLEEAQQQSSRAKKRTVTAERSHQQAQDVEQKATAHWTALLSRVGLRTSLTVDSAPQMLQAIERAHDQLLRVSELRQREQSIQSSVDAYRNDVRSAARTAGRAEPKNEDLLQFVSTLVAQLREHEDNHRRADGLRQKILKAGSRLDLLQRQIDQRQQEIDRLLAAAAVKDEESFRHRASDYERGCELRKEIQQLETRLRQLVGGGQALQKLEEALKQTKPEQLSSERETLKNAIEIKEQERSDATDKRGRLQLQLEQLETNAKLSELRMEEQSSRAELSVSADEWAVLKITSHLIDRAREKYERERRPAVLKEAERYFTNFTKGNYTEIRAPVGEDQIIVLTPAGVAKDISQLSRGTAEQLYLSLRFGFVREFVGRSEPLPLVFDDILVNFDPARARAAAEAIIELSKSLQILFFTCQPATVALIKDIDESVPVFGLKNGSFTAVA